MFNTPEGGKEMKMMEIDYTKDPVGLAPIKLKTADK
jgi:hypothetical protein